MVRNRRTLAAMAAAGVLAIVGTFSTALAAPGNNGTVKVDGVDIDKVENANEPHVGCTFSIEWYGFDADNTTSYVTFEAQPPTGTRLLLQDSATLDGDDATGGGSIAGFDGSKEFTLDFNDGDYYHPKQGYHVYLTVETPTANGSIVKHKVFWVTGCDVPPPPV